MEFLLKQMAVLFAILSVLSLTKATLADPRGPAILAKTSGNAIVMWQATNEVIALEKSTPDNATALKTLELDAVRVAKKVLGQLDHATSLSVHILYERIGSVSPQYHASTFGGFEKLATVMISATALTSHSQWDKALARSTLPAGITVHVTGALPSR